MWPAEISRATLDPYYARAEAGLRVSSPGWDQVSKSGGLWAAMLDRAGHSCDRVPLAINQQRCVDAKWCHTGCIFGAKNSLITNYLASAEAAGVEVRPLIQVNEIRQSSLHALPLPGEGAERSTPRPRRRPARSTDIECKVLILAAGAMGTPPILMRSQQAGALPSISVAAREAPRRQRRPRRRDRVRRRRKVRSSLGLPGYADFFKGKPITTMSYDWWVGRPGTRTTARGSRSRRSCSPSSPTSSTTTAAGTGRSPSWWGREKKRSISTWNSPHRDPRDGRGHARRHLLRGAARRRRPRPRRTRGRSASGSSTTRSRSSRSPSARRRTQAIEDVIAERRARPLPEADRDPGRLRGAPARRLPDGRRPGPRRRGRPLRGVRQRGALLHGLLGDPDQPRGQSLADDLRRLRASGRARWSLAPPTSTCPRPAPGTRFGRPAEIVGPTAPGGGTTAPAPRPGGPATAGVRRPGEAQRKHRQAQQRRKSTPQASPQAPSRRSVALPRRR